MILSTNPGESFIFLNQKYTRKPFEKLNVGDEVIIHPVPGKSEATKSYPARVVITKNYAWTSGAKDELSLEGINENKGWHGAILNEYGFERLEFVRRELSIS